MYIAQRSGICGGQYAQELKKLILCVLKKIPVYENMEAAAALAVYDKKNDDGRLSLIVPQSEGISAEIKLSLQDYTRLLKECAATL